MAFKSFYFYIYYKKFCVMWCLVRASVENGWKWWKNSSPIYVSIFFFGRSRNRVGKVRIRNGVKICGHTETYKYEWRAKKLSCDHMI